MNKAFCNNVSARPYTVRIVKIACSDSIGQDRKTFTVDENDNQNSPSFNSYYDFCNWKNLPFRYQFRADLQMTKAEFKNALLN
jgi:hypothetical protein